MLFRSLITGGETTVALPRDHGTGGRNQQLALAAAIELHTLAQESLREPAARERPRPRVTILAAGTDGRDGPTDAAGAIIDAQSWGRMVAAGLDPAAHLRRCDAYPALDRIGALFDIERPIAGSPPDIRRAVRAGLEEDLGEGDITTSALFSKQVPAQASIIAQQPMVVAGLAAAVQTFLMVDPSLRLTTHTHDGDHIPAGAALLDIEGDGRTILQAERVALNFLQHLSGIATLTNKFCQAVRQTPARILDTRKTLPGWRALQKWAVALGGGTNHRFSLGDGLLIKDNHLALLQKGNQAVRTACRLAQRDTSRDRKSTRLNSSH